ncbi:hypothetical protein [Cereibacter sediminicola]|nr:hypothetical protein [Cereibacter sediminicola]
MSSETLALTLAFAAVASLILAALAVAGRPERAPVPVAVRNRSR